MARPKLTPEEREARRKERNRKTFSDTAYVHYDTSEGYGSAEEWTDIAGERLGMSPEELLAALRGAAREYFDQHSRQPKSKKPVDPMLAMLGLEEMPQSYDVLYQAYRSAARVHHPDVPTGSHDAFLALQKAYDRLKIRFGK